MSEPTTRTHIGTDLSEADVAQIWKESRKETIKTILAGIGVVALASFALGIVRASRAPKITTLSE